MDEPDLERALRRAIEIQQTGSRDELAELFRAAEEAGVDRNSLVAAILEQTESPENQSEAFRAGDLLRLPGLTPDALDEAILSVRKLGRVTT